MGGPFLILLPAAVYVATTADALYMGIGAWAALIVGPATAIAIELGLKTIW